MGDAVPITAKALPRVEELIREGFNSQGSIVQDLAELPIELKQWRSAARRVAKGMGRPVKTGVNPEGDVVWAAVADWPATPDEDARMRASMRRAILSLPDVTRPPH